jgi:excisionase family DNA binding protein
MDGDPVMTVAEIAADMRVGRMTVYRAVRSGDLRGVQLGRLIRVRRSAYDAWLLSRSAANAGLSQRETGAVPGAGHGTADRDLHAPDGAEEDRGERPPVPPPQSRNSAGGGQVPPAMTIDFRSHEPSYKQLARILRAKISHGAWEHGGQLPSIRELCDGYALSETTVSHALGVLASEGVVVRVRHYGTFITRPESPPDVRCGPLTADPSAAAPPRGSTGVGTGAAQRRPGPRALKRPGARAASIPAAARPGQRQSRVHDPGHVLR